jgi:trimeric autotransporter adhesin
LKATPSSGTTFGNQNQNQVVVSVNPQGITPQVCSGNVTLTVPGSTAAPLVIPVTFNVSNNALLSVSQSAINVVAVAGAAATMKTVSVTATSGSLAFTATASTNPAGLTWLAVTPNAGSTPNNLQVTISPANLGVGVYSGSIVVSSTASNVPAQTIPVTLTIVASTAVASPTNLTFTQAAGGAAPDSQSVQIAGVPSGTTIGVIPTVLSGSAWLTATASGDTVTVTANGSQLAQGTYTGVVTVIVPGAGASPLYIPVTLNVTAATSAIALSTNAETFNVSAGSTSVPVAQSVQVTSTTTGTSAPFTASFVPSTGGNFLTVTPTSGNTPATLALAVDPAVSSTLAAGTYSGDVQVSSGTGAVQTVKVSLIVNPAGTPVVLSVVNGASLQPGAVSPGQIVTIFGNNIGPATPTTGTEFTKTASGMVPTTLVNVSVTFNNVAAPLIFVAPGQINLMVPYEIAGQTSVPVVVTNNGTPSAITTVNVAATAPSIFSLSQNGNGQGAILNQDESINGTSNPAAPGSIISIYATGEGQLVPAGTTGCITGGTLPLPKPVANVSVTIGGEPATPILYAGEAPDQICGLIQINATLPSDLSAGPQPVVLTIGAATNAAQSITVAVK